MNKICRCGKEIIGYTNGDFGSIHNENGLLKICEPKFKIGSYVKYPQYNHIGRVSYMKIYNGELEYNITWLGCQGGSPSYYNRMYKENELIEFYAPEYFEKGYRLTEGCVFEKDSNKYVVYKAGVESGNCPDSNPYTVYAKKMKDDKYDPNGEIIRFEQFDLTSQYVKVIDILEKSFI